MRKFPICEICWMLAIRLYYSIVGVMGNKNYIRIAIASFLPPIAGLCIYWLGLSRRSTSEKGKHVCAIHNIGPRKWQCTLVTDVALRFASNVMLLTSPYILTCSHVLLHQNTIDLWSSVGGNISQAMFNFFLIPSYSILIYKFSVTYYRLKSYLYNLAILHCIPIELISSSLFMVTQLSFSITFKLP